MRTNSIFAGIVSLFIVFLLFGMGLFLVSLQWGNNLREHLSEILMYNPKVFFFFGLSFIGLALIFLGLFYSMFHHRYLTLRVKPFFCDVDSQIISKYVKRGFEKVLKEKDIEVEVFPKSEKLEIIAYISQRKEFEEALIDDAKETLSAILKKNFGYNKEFLLTIKFR